MAESLTRATLTSRELEVLRLVVIGQANKLIARELDIELSTVKSHVSAIMSKLGARSRTEAARIASSRGLVDEESRFTGHSPTRSSQAETGLQPA